MRSRTLVPFAAACLAAALCAAAALTGCRSGLAQAGRDSILVVSYNVHNLFDAHDDGAEYPEFRSAAGWTAALYRSRLERVAEALVSAAASGRGPGAQTSPGRGPGPGAASGARAGHALPASRAAYPDIVCLQEIENERILADLAAGPLSPGGYGHLAIAPAEGSAVNCGLLSRLPLVAVRSHALEGRAGKAARRVLEAEVEAGGRRLVVLVCHWKSRIEGDEETEGLRRESAALVRSRVARLLAADPAAEVLVCGDFNEGPDEYLRAGRRYATAFMPADEAASCPGSGRQSLLVTFDRSRATDGPGELALFSPWGQSEGYSYCYRGERERLDGFLLSPGLLDVCGLGYGAFEVCDRPFLLDPKGSPLAWSSASAVGYSDHLPIALRLELLGGP
jgi:endonuclease/exonuclease/phosphatase family metal-dependent hydrolase